MRDVREICFVRPNAARDLQRLLDVQMCRMWFLPQRINDQNLHPRDKINNRIRDGAAVAKVSDQFFYRTRRVSVSAARKKIAVNDGVSMRHGQRSDSCRSYFEWAVHH